MTITIKAGMSSPDDADAFNKLSVYCMERLMQFDGQITGKSVTISITGDPALMQELMDYLENKQYGF